MNVILDLDNTIINALEEHEREALDITFQNKFQYHDLTSYGMRIFARPGLQEFLDFLFANFNVSVFTAAEQEYGSFIVENFLKSKPGRKVHKFFWRYHVDSGLERFNAMKDLRLLFNVMKIPGFYPCNTVIIDDLLDVFEANPKNTLRIKSFDVTHGGVKNDKAEQDKELLRIRDDLDRLNKRFKRSACVRQIYKGQVPRAESPFDL